MCHFYIESATVLSDSKYVVFALDPLKLLPGCFVTCEF